MHDPKQKYQAGALEMTCELEQQYNTHRRIREKLLCTFSEKADAVFTSVADSVVAKLTVFDARFDGFMDALTNILLDWCDDRIQGFPILPKSCRPSSASHEPGDRRMRSCEFA